MPATMPLIPKESLTLNPLPMSYLGSEPGGAGAAEERSATNKGLKPNPSRKTNFMRLAGFLKTEIHLSDQELEEAISEARVRAAMRGAE